MGLASRPAYPKQLDERIHDMFMMEYERPRTFYTEVIVVLPPKPGRYIRQAAISGLGPLRTKPEGSMVQLDEPVEGNEVSREYTTYALAFSETEEMREDELFGKMELMAADIGESAAYKKETVVWDLFNNGFGTHTAWDSNEIWEPTARTTLKTGEAMNNRPSSDAALSETTFQAAWEYYATSKHDSGRFINSTLKKLIVPVGERWTAKNLHEAAGKPGSMDNDINTVKGEGWTWIAVPFLTSTTAWFTLGNYSERNAPFIMRVKRPARIQAETDPMTGNRIWVGSIRFAAYCNNPTMTYATSGA